MKKLFSLVLAAALLLALPACSEPARAEKKPVRIIYNDAGLEKITAYVYDKQGNPIRTETGQGIQGITIYENTYDAEGQLVRVEEQDSNGTLSTHTYEYGGAGQLILSSLEYGKGMFNRIAYEYNANGQMIRSERRYSDPDNVVPNGPMVVTSETYYSYDAQGRLMQSEENNLRTVYEYDAQGRKIREDTYWDDDGSGGYITYAYNAEGLLSRMNIYTDRGPLEWLEAYYIYEY